MIAQCLRIGNYVQDNNGFIFNVVSIHDDGTVYCDFKENEGDVWEFDNNNPCQGIEITEEILLKCGDIKWLLSAREGYYVLINNKKIRIKFVHLLQNIYFYIEQKELKINL